MIPSPGETFHGRDVFAPAAALLAAGDTDLENLGPTLADDEVTPMLLPLTEIVNSTVAGEAWWIDGYGNVQTNVSPEDLDAVDISPGEAVTVKVGSTLHTVKWVTSYSDVQDGDPMLHVDSSGLLALAVRGGSAVEAFSIAEGVSITLAGRRAPKPE